MINILCKLKYLAIISNDFYAIMTKKLKKDLITRQAKNY